MSGGRNEALEQEIDALRIDLGDAEAIADHRIGGGTAALAQDALGAREAHDIVHGEEVRRVFELGRDGELVIERTTDVEPHAVRIAALSALFGESDQRLLRRGIALARLIGIIIFELFEREAAALQEAQGFA
jgi:hypothetical protein